VRREKALVDSGNRFAPSGSNQRSGGSNEKINADAARAAGLSKDQQVQAVRVANIPVARRENAKKQSGGAPTL